MTDMNSLQQVAYRKTVEDRMVVIRAQHTDKVLSLTTQLEKLRNSQAQQLQDLNRFRAELDRQNSKELDDLKKAHQLEMGELLMKMESNFSRERTSLEAIHATEMSRLKKELEDQIKCCTLAMTEAQEEKIAAEKRLAEESEKFLRADFSKKEEELNHQISTFSNDLRIARDKLALSEKKVADLLSQFEERKASSAKSRNLLAESEAEVGRLKGALREATVELEIAREHYQQQSAEMKGMAGKWRLDNRKMWTLR